MAEVKKIENYDAPAGLGQFFAISAVAGLIGFAVLIAAFFISGVEATLRAYLLGFTYWCGIAVGCLGLLILQHLTGGSWGLVIRRVLEAGAKTIPLMLILFIPFMIPMLTAQVWEWAHYEHIKAIGGEIKIDKILDHKAPYLNWLFWSGRAVFYFLVWSFMAYFLANLSKRQDETGDWKISNTMNAFSGPGLIAFVLCVTFAAIDWVMALDPHWFSTMFGLLFVIGWALAALSFVVAVMAWLSGREPMNHVLGAAHFHDLGKLMLAMVMVWAYFNFSQFLIIWSGNLPEETPWYLTRMAGGWGIVGVILILFHFAFPFLLLLSRDLKKRRNTLATLAVVVLIMRAVDLFYLIAPNAYVGGAHDGNHLIEIGTIGWGLVALVGVGGIWLAAFIYLLRSRPLMPFNDPFIENAIAHGREHH